MFSLKNAGVHLLSKIITVAFTAIFGVYSFSSGIFKLPPKTPEDFTPIIRFAVCSDIHLNTNEDGKVNAERFAKLFKECYNFSEKSDSYKNFDAVIVAGDMTDEGKEEEYELYRSVIDENIKDGTEMLHCMGNHEYIESRNDSTVDPHENYKKYAEEELFTHKVINGYHFIGISLFDGEENIGKENLKWLEEELDKAVEADPNKPIFVFQHPHPTLTVYGSVNWSDIEVRKVLSKYPQVIDFSGHSHNNSADPRSLWQGSFTAMGTGSLSALLGNLNYIKTDCESNIPSAAFTLVEADENGNVRIRVFDTERNIFFDNIDYFLPNVTDVKNRFYTWGNLRSLDTRPKFPEGSEIKMALNEKGETVLSFPSAEGYFKAESYKVTATKGIKSTYSETVLSNYVSALTEDKEVNLGVLEKGKYIVSVTPSSPYGKLGRTLTAEFSV